MESPLTFSFSTKCSADLMYLRFCRLIFLPAVLEGEKVESRLRLCC